MVTFKSVRFNVLMWVTCMLWYFGDLGILSSIWVIKGPRVGPLLYLGRVVLLDLILFIGLLCIWILS